jgi:hypothetical protein
MIWVNINIGLKQEAICIAPKPGENIFSVVGSFMYWFEIVKQGKW